MNTLEQTKQAGFAARLRALLQTQVTVPRARKGVRLRLTGAGAGFTALICCTFLLSVNFSNNLIFAMTFLLVSIAMISCYTTWRNMRGLQYGDWKSGPVFAGRKIRYTIALANTTAYARYGLRAVSRGASKGNEYVIPAAAKTELVLERKTTGRGIAGAVPAQIESSYPLGLFRAVVRLQPLPETLVYPAPAGGQALPVRSTERHSHAERESDTYSDLRRYSPGDPLSRISWKAYARFDELYTKEFDGGRTTGALMLSLDDVHSRGLEERLSQLCRWVVEASQQTCEYGIELPGTIIQPGSDQEHCTLCLRTLALYNSDNRETV